MSEQPKVYLIRRVVREGDRTLLERYELTCRKFCLAKSLLTKHSLKAIKMLLSENVLAVVHTVFVGEFLTMLKDGVDVDLLGIKFPEDGVVQLVTAGHLTDTQMQYLKDILANKFGTVPNVMMEVEPELLAGLMLRIGDMEIDGSLRERCREYDYRLLDQLEED